MPDTWGGRSTFGYAGSVATGTDITYGKGHTVHVTTGHYAALRSHFRDRIVPAGTSRTDPPKNSLGAWLQEKVTPTAIASYVAAILILEGYAERVGKSEIRVIR